MKGWAHMRNSKWKWKLAQGYCALVSEPSLGFKHWHCASASQIGHATNWARISYNLTLNRLTHPLPKSQHGATKMNCRSTELKYSVNIRQCSWMQEFQFIVLLVMSVQPIFVDWFIYQSLSNMCTETAAMKQGLLSNQSWKNFQMCTI